MFKAIEKNLREQLHDSEERENAALSLLVIKKLRSGDVAGLEALIEKSLDTYAENRSSVRFAIADGYDSFRDMVIYALTNPNREMDRALAQSKIKTVREQRALLLAVNPEARKEHYLMGVRGASLLSEWIESRRSVFMPVAYDLIQQELKAYAELCHKATEMSVEEASTMGVQLFERTGAVVTKHKEDVIAQIEAMPTGVEVARMIDDFLTQSSAAKLAEMAMNLAHKLSPVRSEEAQLLLSAPSAKPV